MSNYSLEELDELERITKISIQQDIKCCADCGICSHDLDFIKRMKNEIQKTPN